jgi:D-proline reductase (dithiol) PrdB
VSLVARHLEANGIPTVMIATARDIVETCGVPRLLFVDYPLGNPCGHPFDIDQQSEILELALSLLETAVAPRTTEVAPHTWPAGEHWKETIFTSEQPFLEGEAYDNWMAAKERYRKLKEEGQA